jgi:hypothetical protein
MKALAVPGFARYGKQALPGGMKNSFGARMGLPTQGATILKLEIYHGNLH